jgi:hypothetical protein
MNRLEDFLVGVVSFLIAIAIWESGEALIGAIR